MVAKSWSPHVHEWPRQNRARPQTCKTCCSGPAWVLLQCVCTPSIGREAASKHIGPGGEGGDLEGVLILGTAGGRGQDDDLHLAADAVQVLQPLLPHLH